MLLSVKQPTKPGSVYLPKGMQFIGRKLAHDRLHVEDGLRREFFAAKLASVVSRILQLESVRWRFTVHQCQIPGMCEISATTQSHTTQKSVHNMLVPHPKVDIPVQAFCR
jgi:hypothetical protein